ncbi:F-box domain/Cupin-like domain/JmjC domain, hydroxylase/Cupin superfamily protein [Novymonas esmeraldas]|uniref:F-box domain/Cupin-like domain/JmjC domain, hydroxylase/Cupin superfamily protein n=1 Tax=Novymonas esmeraldas TaxID=1808958 RepID=A0AAW0EMD1_9TRYP
MQTWYRPHPYGIYPRGNAITRSDIFDRLGTLSLVTTATTDDDKEHTEQPYLELVQHLLSFLEVPELCRLSRSCTGWYVLVHCTDAFKTAYTALSPSYLRFRGSWKETAVRGYREARGAALSVSASAAEETPSARKRSRAEGKGRRTAVTEDALVRHTSICVRRRFFCDHLFQAWMCTLLPAYYHLQPVAATTADEAEETASASLSSSSSSARVGKGAGPAAKTRKTRRDAAWPAAPSTLSTSPPLDGSAVEPPEHAPQYRSSFRPVERCSRLSVAEFHDRFERPNVPVVITDVATEWPLFKLLQARFANLAEKKDALVRSGCPATTPLRCEYTHMSLEDYVRYATEQRDERPIYLFDAEFGSVLDAEALYTVPPHFARDDFFATLGERRPKFRWLIAGPRRGGSSFHVDPNYTSAWNANMTGRKRWLLFPPGATPPGVVPSADMAEVATPVSLTEWLLNYYDASLQGLQHRGYECVCEPGDIMFVPCGWWHFVINLEDSVAITQNYVSRCNLPKVIKFLRAMKRSISGIDEDADDATEESTARRQRGFAQEFEAAMEAAHPALMQEVAQQLEEEHQAREKRRLGQLTLLDPSSEGFTFNF